MPEGKRIGIIGLDTSHSTAFTRILDSSDIFTFIAAAEESKKAAGAPVKMEEAYKQAQNESETLIKRYIK